MAEQLTEEVIKAFAASGTRKVLATVDKQGIPHAVFKGSLHVTGSNLIEEYEILESSQTNSNLVYGIWFDRVVSITLLTEEGKSYQIEAKPVKSITSGKYFEEAYGKVRSRGKDIDLGAIWQFEPVRVKEITFDVRVKEEEETYPLLKHLDRETK